ncbi:MAG: single-stranded DNA-binding protein [Bacteroidia bacterium]|nr:single-stranded DNA-binding protein [Bacteroidia bacterium]
MSVNKVFLLGHVGKDPDVRHLDSGVVKASFTLATSEQYKNKSGEVIKNTEWHNIVLWRNLAEVAEKFVKKGIQVFIEGKITTRNYDDKDGNKRYITEIVGDNMQLLSKKDSVADDSNTAEKTQSSPANLDDIPAPQDDLPF